MYATLSPWRKNGINIFNTFQDAHCCFFILPGGGKNISIARLGLDLHDLHIMFHLLWFFFFYLKGICKLQFLWEINLLQLLSHSTSGPRLQSVWRKWLPDQVEGHQLSWMSQAPSSLCTLSDKYGDSGFQLSWYGSIGLIPPISLHWLLAVMYRCSSTFVFFNCILPIIYIVLYTLQEGQDTKCDK